MKMKNLKNSIPLLLAAAVLVLYGCSDGSDEKNGGALVTSISVTGVPVTPVPDAVSRADWTSADFSLLDLESNQVGEIVIGQASALTNAQITVGASAGAKVKYAASQFDVPENFQDGSTITLVNNGYLILQVTSEDGKTVNYYVVSISLASATATLTNITVGDVTATLGTPNGDYNQAVAGTADLGAALTGKAVTVTKGQSGQTLKFAKVTGNGAPSFGDTATFDFADGDILYIEVTAENGIAKNIYKVDIWGVRAKVPVISPAELPNATYQINDTAPAALTVTISLPDLEEVPATSVLTYQWYSNTQDSNSGGTAITTATTASFTPPTTTLGRTWYYVEVTHTDNAISAAP
ncbi:MAG: hypothetical protein LBK25_07125, partial [Treponema sp.]|nr:hypothetical protein [Treponema sp.]